MFWETTAGPSSYSPHHHHGGATIWFMSMLQTFHELGNNRLLARSLCRCSFHLTSAKIGGAWQNEKDARRGGEAEQKRNKGREGATALRVWLACLYYLCGLAHENKTQATAGCSGGGGGGGRGQKRRRGGRKKGMVWGGVAGGGSLAVAAALHESLNPMVFQA